MMSFSGDMPMARSRMLRSLIPVPNSRSDQIYDDSYIRDSNMAYNRCSRQTIIVLKISIGDVFWAQVQNVRWRFEKHPGLCLWRF